MAKLFLLHTGQSKEASIAAKSLTVGLSKAILLYKNYVESGEKGLCRVQSYVNALLFS